MKKGTYLNFVGCGSPSNPEESSGVKSSSTSCILLLCSVISYFLSFSTSLSVLSVSLQTDPTSCILSCYGMLS